MALWFSFALLAALAVVFLIVPIFMPRNAQVASSREDGALSIHLDQLAEIEADLDRGVISEVEAAAATGEVKRRMLAIARRLDKTSSAPSRAGRAPLVLAAVLVPIAAGGFYGLLGSPETPSLAFADRADEQEQATEIAGLAEKLRIRLESDESGGSAEGWGLLGQTYMRMGRVEDAVWAFERGAEHPDASSAIFSRLAEAMFRMDSGIVTPAAQTAIDRAMELDPSNPAAVFYNAVALDQQGRSGEGYDLLLAALQTAGGFAPWMPSFIDQANRLAERSGRPPLDVASFAPMMQREAAPGPSAGDVAAAGEMSEEDRSVFIRSMVDRLATRLENEPDDLDGWLRLANAYSVLGERSKAIDAYEQADALTEKLPESDSRRTQVQSGLDRLGGGGD